MVSITVSLDDEERERLARLAWVNWSEVAREYLMKREIFEGFIRTGKLSDEDWKFCESTDWHPVDWLPLKEEMIRDLEKARKEPHSKPMTVQEFKKRFGIS